MAVTKHLARCGTPFRQFAQAQNVEGDPEDCDFNKYVLPAGKALDLTQILVSFSGSAEFTIKHDGNIIAKITTSPGQTTFPLMFTPIETIGPGELIEVCFFSPTPGCYSATIFGALINV